MDPKLASLLTLSITLAVGVGGSLGASALGVPDLADSILAFAGGLGLGLLAPQVGK